MAVNYTMKWKYSRFIVLIKTVSSKSHVLISAQSNNNVRPSYFTLYEAFSTNFLPFSQLFSVWFHFFLSSFTSLLSLSSLSFFTCNFYLLPFPSLVSALILCPLVFSNLVSFPHFLFLRHLVHTRFLPSLTSLSSCSSSSLFFIIFYMFVCVHGNRGSDDPADVPTLIARCVLLTHTQTSETQQRLKWQMPQIVIWNTLEGDAGGLWESFFFAIKMR